MKNLHLSTLLTLVMLLGVIQLKAITQEWNFSDHHFCSLGVVDYELNLSGLKVYATTEKPVVFDESTASADGKDFSSRLKLGGAGSILDDPKYRIVSFYVPQNAEIKIICTSSSDIETRELLLVSPAGDTIHTFQAPGGSLNVETYSYSAGAGYVKLLSSSGGINLYYISASSQVDHKVTLFDPATCNPANLPAGMTIVEEGGQYYLKTALNAWSSSFYFDPFYVENEITHLVFEAKYKTGTSGYAINDLQSFFKFIEPNWSEVSNLQFPASTEFMEYRLPVFSGSGLWCNGMLVAGREQVSGDGNAITGDTIFIGKITAYINEPNVIFNPANYDDSTLPAGMSIVQIENKKYLQVITDGWNSILTAPRFEITAGHTARCNHKYIMGSATADTLSANQVQSMIILIDNENTIPNPWGEGEIQARLTLLHNPAPNEISLMSGEFTNEMQYVDVVQFAGQQNVSWGPTTGDTIWVSKIEHIYIVPPPPSHIEVLKTTIAPMLDGVEEQCWNGVEAVPLAQNFAGEDPTVNAYWKAMWADSGLFVLVNVQDDNHYPAWEAGSFETWTYDLSDVALDVNAVLDDGLGAQHNQGHYLHSGVFLEALYGSSIQNGIFTYANQLSGENRISEYYIPFNEMQNKNRNFLNKDSLLLLDAIGFDVYVTDQDQGISDRRHRKVWQNTGSANENWSNMDDAGTIQLIDAPVRLSDSVLVTFRVDMRDEAIGSMGVNLRGSFNNWTSDFAMTCTYDKVYEITLELPKNQYFEYKFRNGEMWESPEGDCNAGGDNTNRTLNVASENLILDLVCYNSCFMCPPSYIEVAKTETAPLLDGVIDDVWNNTDAIPVSKKYLWENPTVDAYWKAMWADSGIFVLINAQDDIHFPSWESGGNDWEFDQVEVYFDVNENLIDGRGSKDNQGHYSYSPVFAETAYGTVQNNGPVSYSNLLYGESFVSEMYFPFNSFQNEQGQTLSKNNFLLLNAIGFDVYVIDRDSMETNRQRKVWQNNGLVTENWGNMDDAGIIRLVGEAPNFDLVESDSLALLAIYNATGGDNWNNKQNWLITNANEWYGVSVENCRVVELNLGENNLSGQLPAELANLTALRTLNLGGNGNLDQGAIPDLSGLTSLRELVFYSSNRNGTVPDWLLQSNTIERINLSGNALTGAIPTNFSYPLNIKSIDVGWCQFDTPIGFPDFSAFTNLEAIRLAGCNITAQVPAYFEGFANLFNLHIDNNHLWGDLPAGLKSQTNLTNLDIQWNNFTFGNFAAAGIVPSQMGGMNYEPQANVQLGRSETETQVTFDASGFGGEAFKWFKDDLEIAGQTGSSLVVDKTNKGFYRCEITNSQYPNLTLVSNAEDVGVFTNGIYNEEYDALVVFYNALNGDNWDNNTNWLSSEPVSTWYGLDVWENHVVGIGLWWNNLDGDVPADIAAFTQLRNLNLSGNIIASIPIEIGSLGHLTNIDLSNNQIISLPTSIGELTDLDQLYLANNQLTSLSAEIGNLDNLRGLNLSGNQLNALPASVGDMAKIEWFELFGNQLTTLPAEMNNLTTLNDLWLAHNQLESLPNLSALTLSRVGIDYNKLTYADIVGSGINPSIEFFYNDQAKVEADYNDVGTGYTLDVSFAGAQTHQWYKNGVEMPAETNALLTVSGYAGDYYYCVLNHSAYPNLTLESEPQSVAGYLTHGIVTAEYNALEDLYNATNGSNWRDNWNWLSDAPINEWTGVYINGIHVSEIHLGGNKLSGSLPASFNSFTELKRVNFYGNMLNDLPDLSGLTNIEFINVVKNALDFNDLTEANFTQPIDFDFQYFNQQNILVNRSENSGQITFTVPDVGGTWFQWYHNSVAMPGEESNTLTVDNTANGYYYCIIGNSTFQNLQLQTVAEEVGESNLTCGILTSEYNALVAIYNATGGNNWNNNTNWLSTNPASTWQGVTVNGVNVTWLDLGYNNLTGILPGETADLTKLDGLQFRGNHLSALHSNVGNLAYLSTFDLCDNDFTAFPEAVCGIGSLRWLYLDNNEMVGTIPDAIGNLTNMWDIFLCDNQLSGQIPSSMANMTQLICFDFSRNNLSGALPAAMGNNPALREFRMSGNQYHHAHIEQVMAWANFAGLESFEYAPQQMVGSEREIFTTEDFSVQLFIDGYITSVNDQYQWYKKDGTPIVGATLSYYRINDLSVADSDTFYCVVNNTVTSQLTLQSRNIALSVGSIGLVGTFNNWGAQPDVPFVQSSANPELWQLDYHFENNAWVKFRLNENWSINWGGDSFPQSSMVDFGNDILVSAGYYEIELDMDAKTYSFSNVDSLALVALYNSTGGDNWNRKANWLTGPLNTWEQVTVENGRVVGLNFGWDNNMVGTLPSDIGNLTAIKWLIASGNDGLTGSIPAEIGNLTNLETLIFYNCNLTGTIPPEILNLDNLQTLELSFNNFDAAPMPNFGQLNLLRNLVIEECYFTGDMPAGLSNLTLLENFYMNNNPGLNAGPIPDLSSSPNIVNLGMAGCNRTGTIPAWITQLVNLETLNLNGNSLTENIPATFSNAAYIRELDFGWNQFTTASLPDFSSFESLQTLILAGCNLNGTVPQWVSTLVNLEDLNVSYNMLEGALPENIGNLTNMEFLNIEANRLSGSLPASLSNMVNLREFYLNNNQLSGNMPVMSGLSQLFILRNSNNKHTFANIAATGLVPGDITHFVYSEQDTILGIQQDGNTLTALDCGHDNNQIVWYRDGDLVANNSQSIEADQSGDYYYIVSNTVYNFLTLYSDTIYVEVATVPIDREVFNYSLSDGNTDCLDAQNDITVAGEGTSVDIYAGAATTFIAGHSIRFLPGFHAHADSYVNAYITTTGSFCDDLPEAIMAAPPVTEKSLEFVEPEADLIDFIEKSMVVYPNPNNGQFTIAFTNFEGTSQVFLFNAMGQKVYAATVTEQQLWVELPNLQRGIYFVKAINKQKQFERKIVVQ